MSTAPGIGSPCTSVCRMDDDSGWCRGCLRTLDEIAAWSTLDDAGRRAVLQQLPARRRIWRMRPGAALPVPEPRS